MLDQRGLHFQLKCLPANTMRPNNVVLMLGQRHRQHIYHRQRTYCDVIFYYPFKSQLFGTNCVFKHQDLKMFDLKLNTDMDNFHPFEVVDRGSETQLWMGVNLNYLN